MSRASCVGRIVAAVLGTAMLLWAGAKPAHGQAGAQADADAPVQIDGLPADAGVLANRTGFCLDLGCGDGALALRIAQRTKYTVFAVAREEADCDRTRRALDGAGLYGTRATAVVGSLSALPLPDGYGNLIVTGDYRGDLNLKEVLRVLGPNGLAVIGGAGTDAGRLKAALAAAGIADLRMSGPFAVFRGRMPAGADDWTHAARRPDNIVTSRETRVRPPFRTQWLQGHTSREAKFVCHTAIAAGRIIYRSTGYKGTPDHYYVWDSFNGILLWERVTRDKNDWYFALVDGVYYTQEADRIIALDAATGREKRAYQAPGSGYWLWMAVDGGTLYALGRGAVKEGYFLGDTLYAIDLAGGAVKWKYASDYPLPMCYATMGGGAVYSCGLQGTDKGELIAVDAATGQPRWRTEIDLASVAWPPASHMYPSAGYLNGRLMVWTAVSGTKAFDARTGELLKEYPKAYSGGASGGNEQTAPLFLGDRMYHSAGRKYRCVDLASGDEINTGVDLSKAGCGPGTASANCLYSGGQGFSVTDLEARVTWSPTGLLRTSCVEGAYAANGLLLIMPSHCGCAYPLKGPIAMAPAGDWKPPAAEANIASRLVRGPAFDAPPAAEEKDGWTHFRGGPGHTGQAAAAPKTPLVLAWQRKLGGRLTDAALADYRPIDQAILERKLGEWLTPPSFGGGRVYVASRDAAVWALDPATGEIQWKAPLGGGVRVTPAYWRGRLLVGSDDGCVYCLDAATGRLAWRFRAAPEDRYISIEGQLGSTWPVAMGVAVEDGVAYAAAGLCGYDGAYLCALDAATGKPRWVRRVDGASSGMAPNCDGTPQGILALAGDCILVPRGVRGLVAYRKDNGERIVWETQRLEDVNPRPPGSEAVADGEVFFIGGPAPFGTATAPFSAADARTGLRCGTLARGAAVTDSVMGRIAPDCVAPVLAKDTVVGDGVGFDRATFFQTLRDDPQKLRGAAAWSVGLWPEKDQMTCALALAGDVLLAGGRPCSADGKPLLGGVSQVAAFEARPDGKQLARVTLPGRIIRNSLAVGDGRLFVATQDGSICCLSGK
jgi:outer membrane protein assembly factor BamB